THHRIYGFRQVLRAEEEYHRLEIAAGRVAADRLLLAGTLLIDEAEAAVVRFLFESCAEGESLSGLVKRLRDSGQRTRYGNAWGQSVIRRLLRNEAYGGRAWFGKRT